VIWVVSALLIVAGAAGCGGARTPLPAAGSVDADKFLHDRGQEELAKKHWIQARLYFRTLVDTYPASPYRYAAKLGIGDSYLGENRIEAHILAAHEFREFLTYFPGHERADYAQYKLAVAQMRQMLAPERDQTATREALRELNSFLERFPRSTLRPEVEKLHREVRDRLSESELRIGRWHYRSRLYFGALGRLLPLLADDPGYTRKDSVLFYLGQTYFALNAPVDARKYFEWLLKEYPTTEHAEDARERLDQIKALEAAPAKGAGVSGAGSS
jgi:outer membrane protein assembly factor BamD